MSSGTRHSEDLERFLEAQSEDYDRALAELRAGRKRTHWIWYVLPQLRGLGLSAMSQTYGIASLQEARDYLAHPVLGSRLRECVMALDQHRDKSIQNVLGDVDAMKYRSCLTLFRAADISSSLFDDALKAHFSSEADESTLRLLARQ